MDRVNIVYAANDHYAALAGVSMYSLFENNRECSELCVYVLSDHISIININNLQKVGEKYQRKVEIIDIREALKIFEQKGAGKYANENGGGYAAFAKLLIPDVIPNEKRIVYLDCDTLILDNIADLGQMSMNGKALGMAQDCIQNRYKKFICVDEGRNYFNSGVIVFDILKWKENRCMERLLWHLENVRSHYPLPDQDLINVVLYDDIFCLHMKYNYLSQYFLYPQSELKKVYGLQDTYFHAKNKYVNSDKAIILHFCGQTFIRPWYCNSRHPAKEKYDYYYKLSPWRLEGQKRYKWKLEYRIQYILWKYMPIWLSALCGKWMQRIFMWLQYKV